MRIKSIALLTLTTMLSAVVAEAAIFDGAGDNELDSLGYYYAITGGKFPTGDTPNGSRPSGGTFRYLTDDPAWGKTIDVWHKDGWFADNAGFAVTLKNGGAIVYDNNGIEDGTYGNYYDGTGVAQSANVHGLYRGYSMSNNYDWIYAGYFLIEEETTIDTLIGYFDETAGFDRNSPLVRYGMNIWSNVDGDLLPVNTGGFAGDVFSSDNVAGTFATSDTGVDRIYGDDYANATDDIFRLTYTLDAPLTLDAGIYWFSHDARIVPEPATMVIWAVLGSLGLLYGWRRRRAA